PLNIEKTKLENLLNKMLDVDTLENLKKVQNEIINLNSSDINTLIGNETKDRYIEPSFENTKESSLENKTMLSLEHTKEPSLENKKKFSLENKKESSLESKKELSTENKKLIYGALYENLRYAALMLNLVSLERVFATQTTSVNKYSQRGIFKQEIVIKTDIPSEIINMVCGKINSIEDYRGSNILPFTLLNAEKMVMTEDFKNAIHSMLEVSAKESFNLKEDTSVLVGVDTSSSMSVNVSDSLSAIDVASFFGALIKSSHEASKICAVATTCDKVNFTSSNIFNMAYDIERTDVGYGTYFESIMKEYTDQKYIILITDSMAADDLEKLWINAKKPKGAKLIVWQLAAYKTKISKDPSVIYLAGYSDRLLSLIKSIIESDGNQIDEIEKIDIFK
ncbi:MAG: hypothetical protein FWC47_11960, partial [Oscillospiraceae bacterium]|nr:hypothetical protein [Oscillospiraceae bacterium]